MVAAPTERRREGDFLASGGEMGALIRGIDWSQSALGPPSAWPQSLRTAVSILLNSRHPMFVFWGPQRVQIYNDAYRPMLGRKHPWALGRPAREVWPEIWDTIGPMVERVVDHGEATWSDDLLLFIERHGFPEEVYFTFSYSPIRDESGGIGGLFCAPTETTTTVLGERRLRTLHDLASGPSEARTIDDACRSSSQVLESNISDIPFSLIYVRQDDDSLRCVGRSGVGADAAIGPAVVHPGEEGGWPLASVIETARPQVVGSLSSRFAALPQGPWPEPPHTALLWPLLARGSERPTGVVVLGVGSRRTFDEKYREFSSMVAKQIAASMANARAYEEERRQAEALAQLDRAKTAFFSNVSHEFRTPLALMLGPLQDILSKPDPTLAKDDRELLTVVHRNGLRLLKLVNTLLDFSRIEAGRVQATYEPVALEVFTAELAGVFGTAASKAGLQLHVDCPALPEPIYVDPDMWEKIVLNLLSNAFKYTLEGEIVVSLGLEGEHAVLQVRDTGTGIPASELPKLFQRFHRVEGAHGRTHEGSGIGLALVHELVKLHGGTVRAESTLGHGSTFRVSIPRGTAHLPADRIGRAVTLVSTVLGAGPFVEEALRWLPEDASTEPQVLTTDEPHVARPTGGTRPRVLVVDDNADVRDYVTRLLLPRYDVTTAVDGRQALALAREAPPDLILTDVMMPHLDGLGLLRALRDDPTTAPLPVILLSARAGEEARLEGIEAGADDYLVKPFGTRELLARVSGSLALAQARRETVAALRQSEEQFRHLANNAPVMVWVTDQQGQCTFLSETWYDFTGQAPDTGLGLGWAEALHPDDRGHIRETFHAANEHRAAFRHEYRLRHVDGGYRWVLDAAAPHWSPEGTFLGYIGSLIEITDRKRAEQALEQADRRKDEFLATLAHELRNPLAPIRAGLDVLRHLLGQEHAGRRPLEIMERQLGQLVRLVDDLLDVSRISRGKIALRTEPMDLRAAIRSALETTQPLVRQRGHALQVELCEQPLTVQGDADRLAQVFSNLLNNAATYTDRGGHLRVRAHEVGAHELRTHDGPGQAVVQVQDDGIGLPPEEAAGVFELFTQLDSPQGRLSGGLGIGLSLVKQLVELHGGTVGVHSEGLGRGATFEVRLPLLSSQARPAAGAPSAPQASPAGAVKILVVDDNEGAAVSLAMLLEVTGHEVRVAHGGAEGVELAERFRPELVLLDLGMPEVDGYEACRRLRARPWGRALTIVALTGWGQDQVKQRTREAGFDEHWVKPVDRDTIRALLGRLRAG